MKSTAAPLTAARRYDECKKIISRYEIDEALTLTDRSRIAELAQLTCRRIVRKENPRFPGAASPYYVHVDGRELSIKKACQRAASQNLGRTNDALARKDVVKALRAEVATRVDLAAVSPRECACRGCDGCTTQGHGASLEVDHEVGFAQAANEFLRLHPSPALASIDGGGHRLASRALGARWLKIHDKMGGKLQRFCVRCHLAKTRRLASIAG